MKIPRGDIDVALAPRSWPCDSRGTAVNNALVRSLAACVHTHTRAGEAAGDPSVTPATALGRPRDPAACPRRTPAMTRSLGGRACRESRCTWAPARSRHSMVRARHCCRPRLCGRRRPSHPAPAAPRGGADSRPGASWEGRADWSLRRITGIRSAT